MPAEVQRYLLSLLPSPVPRSMPSTHKRTISALRLLCNAEQTILHSVLFAIQKPMGPMSIAATLHWQHDMTCRAAT
jgi:hypothetical protein